MPWCPKCKVEYREGFTHCNDCGAELVNEPENNSKEKKDPPTKSPRINKGQNRKTKIKLIEEVFLVNVGNEVEIAYITSMLEQEGITYRIVEVDAGQYLRIYLGRSYYGYSVLVALQDYEKARTIVNSLKVDVEIKNKFDVLVRKNEMLLAAKGIIWWYVTLSLLALLMYIVIIFLFLTGNL